jgi:hypothetical protein
MGERTGDRTGAALVGAAALLLGLAAVPQASAASAPRHGVARVSTTVAGNQAATASDGGGVTGDGRYAVYGTEGPDGTGCPAAFGWCVFVKDLRTGRTVRVPGADVEDHGPMLSGDGSKVGRPPHRCAPDPVAREPAERRLVRAGRPHRSERRRPPRRLHHRQPRRLRLRPPPVRAGPDHSGTRNASGTALYVTDRATRRTRRLDTPAGGASSLVDISADGHRVLFNFAAP